MKRGRQSHHRPQKRKSLAVVIPVYKVSFLPNVLEALSTQTNTNFVVYIGNDASGDDVEKVVRCYESELRIIYHRFNNNLGKVDLAAQWNRCLSLVQEEAWVWVLGDDDLPSLDCVAEILAAIDVADQIDINVMHLPVVKIDSEGRDQTLRQVFPFLMNATDHYLMQLRGHPSSMTLSNTIYRRVALNRSGGFVSFRRGWGSDHATPLLVADGGSFLTVQNAWVGFRMSGENISSDHSDAAEKLQGRLEFAEFLSTHLRRWCSEAEAQEIFWRSYARAEFYVTKIWPFTLASAVGLFKHAEICGVPRSRLQKLAIISRGLKSRIFSVLDFS